MKDESIRKLHDSVKELKKSRDLEGHYMTIEELLERREAAGKEEGRTEGRTAGRGEMLQEQIQKKLEKGKDISTIAKELEADVSTIERLVVQIEKDS